MKPNTPSQSVHLGIVDFWKIDLRQSEGLGDPTPTKTLASMPVLDCLVAMKCQHALASFVARTVRLRSHSAYVRLPDDYSAC